MYRLSVLKIITKTRTRVVQYNNILYALIGATINRNLSRVHRGSLNGIGEEGVA